jgi:hypothetical protein
MRVQDRLDDVLQSRPLSHDLVAACHLPAQRLCRFVRNPDFRQKPAGVKLGKNAGVDRVGLDLRMRDDTHLHWVCDHHLLHLRPDDRRDRCGIPGRLDDDDIVLRKPFGERGQQRTSHVHAAETSEFAILPSHRFRKGAVDIKSDNAHACSLSGLTKRELAGNTTSTDPRSRRIRESRKGRPCNELGLSAHCLSAACPHLRAPGAPRPGWAHHNAVLRREQPDEKAPPITYRITARPSASSKLPFANGHTLALTRTQINVQPNWSTGSIATIGIGRMVASKPRRPSVDSV